MVRDIMVVRLLAQEEWAEASNNVKLSEQSGSFLKVNLKGMIIYAAVQNDKMVFQKFLETYVYLPLHVHHQYLNMKKGSRFENL